MFERVLVPLDGSKVGEAALPVIEQLVDKLASKTKVEVTLLGVITILRHWVVVGEASAPVSYTEEELTLINIHTITVGILTEFYIRRDYCNAPFSSD